MSEPHKKIKGEKGGSKSGLDFEKIYQDLIASSQGCDDHPYVPLLKAIRTNKKPILQVVHAQGDVFKTNP